MSLPVATLLLHIVQDYTAFKAKEPSKALKSLRAAAILAVSWATCKRLKNVKQLSLAGLAIAIVDMPENPSGVLFALHLGTEKARHSPDRVSYSDEVGPCVTHTAALSSLTAVLTRSLAICAVLVVRRSDHPQPLR